MFLSYFLHLNEKNIKTFKFKCSYWHLKIDIRCMYHLFDTQLKLKKNNFKITLKKTVFCRSFIWQNCITFNLNHSDFIPPWTTFYDCKMDALCVRHHTKTLFLSLFLSWVVLSKQTPRITIKNKHQHSRLHDVAP